ncbi:unnamed protein product [Spirodela intermedia]|uniref:Uncharacterized protein n=1 Tax=Spirodela intermedia TaxID=51605 RepID=A0A7I8KMA6_SPIIN|nr:unnamed protein product [Spirodela intermedia]
MADAFPKFRPPELAELAVSYDGLQFWQFMVAGSVAGVVEHTAMFPVDTLKTRMQAQRPPCRQPASLRRVLSGILKLEAPLSLYRGISAMGLGAVPAHAVYFSVYEASKEFLTGGNPNSRLQLRGSRYRGAMDCVRKLLREEGTRAFLVSYRTTVVMNAPFTAVHFSTYEAAKRALTEVSLATAAGDEERLVVHATAGAAAGALAAFVTTPLDVVKTQLQCQGVCGCERFSGGSILEEVRSIVRRDGYVGLARGWRLRMLFHAPAAAVCWSTYEGAKAFFQEVNQTA